MEWGFRTLGTLRIASHTLTANGRALRLLGGLGFEVDDAIDELALTGVFCGDILPKNFGVTRTGRVVFYDYDEIESVDRPVFRTVPIASDPLDEMAAEPWFGHGPNDAFPEQWLPLLGLRPGHRELLASEFAHLFDPDFWRAAQRSGSEPHEVLPYPESARLGGALPAGAAPRR